MPVSKKRGVVTTRRLLTVPEAAEYLSVTERFIRRLVAERRIPRQYVGRHLRFRIEDLDAWLDEGYFPAVGA